MPQRRINWHDRIKTVEREYLSTRIAVDRLSGTVAHDPGVLGGGVTPRDLGSARKNLEGTYLIRMFAEFETGVRSFWRWRRPHARTGVEVMLDRVYALCGISADELDNAHRVRVYRNTLVHDRDEEVEAVTIADALHHLQTYFSRLPIQWGD